MKYIRTTALAVILAAAAALTSYAGNDDAGSSDIDAASFSPNAHVSVAEGITMAVRMNAASGGKAGPTGSGYEPYIAYAKENGLIGDDDFDDYARDITRAELAALICDAMPEGYYTPVNEVSAVPDVNITSPYADKVLALYRAGVVMGSDIYGTFNPDNAVIRGEADAMINRAARPDRRLRKTLAVNPSRDAYQLIYNTSYSNSLTGRDSSTIDNLPGAWTLDNRGGTPRSSVEDAFSAVVDISETEPAALVRTFNKITDDVLTADISVTTETEGANIEFRDVEGNTAYMLKLIDGYWCVLMPDGGYRSLVPLEDADTIASSRFRVTLDIPSGSASAVINGIPCEATPLLSDNMIDFRYAVDEEGTGAIVPGKINVGANYGVFEWFDLFGFEAYNGWNVEGNAECRSSEMILRGEVTATKSFKPITAKYALSCMFILPSHEDISFTLTSDGVTAVNVASVGGKLVAGGRELYDLTQNMWYRLRVEANPSADTADIRINGRVVGTVPLTCSAPIDALTIGSASGSAKIDYLEVYPIVDHPDYCPIPENRARLDDYTVFLNVCNLWRNNGDHYGWSCITPYDENRPVLGYYDEGSPESADWEIKMMVEHGIDVQAFCWYNDSANGPLKHQHLSEQLNDGYQLAKYADYMKYVLILELNATAFNSAQYRNYVLPFLFENYFLDDRYLKIDNKIVIHTFSTNVLEGAKYFGSADAVKEEMAYTAEVARSYGYDGVLLLGNNGASYIDGRAAYGWGNLGYTYDHNVTQNLNGLAEGKKLGYYMIPTVSVGFNILGWGHTRSPMMDVDTYRKTNLWVRDTYMPANANPDDWTRGIALMSTWNEYGEGTYIMPSGLNGFGYLDVLREVYTDLPEAHTDEIPTDAQLKRITHMFPQHQHALYPLHTGEDVTAPVTPGKAYSELVTLKKVDLKASNSRVYDAGSIAYGVNGLTATSTNRDPRINVSGAIGVDCGKVNYVKITMQAPKGSRVQIFYTTSEGAELSEANSFATSTASDDMEEIIFKVDEKSTWSGRLMSLRLDPCAETGVTFTVKSIEFITVSYPEPELIPSLYANTVKIESRVLPEKKNGKTLFPYDQTTAIQHILFTCMTWDKDNGRLTVEGNRHRVTYTVGSDKYIVDGTERELGYTLYLSDGLPMIDMEGFAGALGFTTRTEGAALYIESPDVGLFEEIAERKEGFFDFDGYDTEGFGSQHFSLLTSGGFLHAESITTIEDQVMLRPNVHISTAQFMGVEFKIRYAYDNAKHTRQSLSLYYITDRDSTWNEAKSVKAKLRGFDSHGEFEVYTVNMRENQNWQNTITSLRFDPFNGYGYVDIDYIHFIEDPDYDPEAERLKEYQIINGDAEDSRISFISNNATISIIEDETDPDNHVWLVEGRPTKSWTYFMQDYKLELGKTYLISYDLRALPDTDGNVSDLTICCNMQYLDAVNAAATGTQRDHNAIVTKIPKDGSWVHVEKEYTIATMDSAEGTRFSLYCNPPSETSSGSYIVDNVFVMPVDMIPEDMRPTK